MKIIDISMPIEENMQVYKNRDIKKPEFEVMRDFSNGGTVRETKVHLDVHTGTHVDAHLHVFEEGQTIDEIPLEQLVKPCKVFDFSHVKDGITSEDLLGCEIESGDFVLFKTQNSMENEFNVEFVYIKEDAARYLAEKNISGVGVDALGVERDQPGHPTHKTLMNANVVIIEGLRLGHVQAGQYFMVAAPLKLQQLDAAPARVFLMEGFPL